MPALPLIFICVYTYIFFFFHLSHFPLLGFHHLSSPVSTLHPLEITLFLSGLLSHAVFSVKLLSVSHKLAAPSPFTTNVMFLSISWKAIDRSVCFH